MGFRSRQWGHYLVVLGWKGEHGIYADGNYRFLL